MAREFGSEVRWSVACFDCVDKLKARFSKMVNDSAESMCADLRLPKCGKMRNALQGLEFFLVY